MALSPGQIVATLTPVVGRAGAAGIAGNLMQESSDRSGAPGGGLAQWQGSRYSGLVKYAQSRGLAPTSDQAALGYLAQDLKGPYSSLANQLRGAKDPATAATLFSNIYERPGTPMLGNRISYARQALGAKGGPLSTMPGGSAAPGGGTRMVTKQGFDQAGFNAAQANTIAGKFVAGDNPSTSPYAVGQAKTGISTGMGANALFTSGALSTAAPNPANYKTAQTTLQKLAGGTPLNQHPAAFTGSLKGSGYTNPLPGATWERTDMGVDASMRNGAPIRALGDSRVTNIHTFYKGQPIITMQLLNGPQAGKFWYVSEAINSNIKPGQTVRAGQTIGTYNSGGTGLELGWAGNAQGSTLAQTTSGYSEGQQTPAGKSFRNFLNGLGANAG